ncbi:MAG TPA: MarR family transcriptional regulator [Armatimonadota bacterium]|nr:MarR family transcriptional regulator [Armatimonadota bacterium]
MNQTETISQTERVSDIFARIMAKLLTAGFPVGPADEITVAQFQALRHIAQHGTCSIGSLAKGLSVSQPAATMLVSRMARRGLAERRPGQRDRRQAEVSLTRCAEDLLGRIETERTQRLAGILSQMPPEERTRLVESLERFIEAALKLDGEVDEICLRCGSEHQPDCIVNQAHLELVGTDIERT